MRSRSNALIRDPISKFRKGLVLSILPERDTNGTQNLDKNSENIYGLEQRCPVAPACSLRQPEEVAGSDLRWQADRGAGRLTWG